MAGKKWRENEIGNVNVREHGASRVAHRQHNAATRTFSHFLFLQLTNINTMASDDEKQRAKEGKPKNSDTEESPAPPSSGGGEVSIAHPTLYTYFSLHLLPHSFNFFQTQLIRMRSHRLRSPQPVRRATPPPESPEPRRSPSPPPSPSPPKDPPTDET